MVQKFDRERLMTDAHDAADNKITGDALKARIAKYPHHARVCWMTFYSYRLDENERNARIAEMEQGEMA